MSELRFSCFLSLFLTLHLAMLAQPGPDTSQWPDGRPGENFNVTDAKGLKQGRWIRVYPDGRLYYSGSFVDGRPVGHFSFFREGGRVLSEVEHDTENNMAKVLMYREDGTVSHQGQYETMQVDGEWTQRKTGLWEGLDTKGRVRLREHYQNDTLDGPQQTFHASGQLLEEGQFKAGKKVGQWTTYDTKGRIRSQEMWREGERHGTSTIMQDNGIKLSEGEYDDGVPVGTWTTFNPDGKERSKVYHEGGRAIKEEPLAGLFSSEYPSGRPEWEGRYAHGRLDGTFTAWYDLGDWVMVPLDQGQGNPNAPRGPGGRPGEQDMKRVLQNQPKMEEGNYTAGVKDGIWRYYDEKGQEIKVERWHLGVLKSTEE